MSIVFRKNYQKVLTSVANLWYNFNWEGGTNGMETVSTVASYIGTLGFPIVCCGVLFYFVNSTLKELRDIISKNTVAITTLIEKLDKE